MCARVHFVYTWIGAVCAFISCDYFWNRMMQCECLAGIHWFNREGLKREREREKRAKWDGGCVTGEVLHSEGKSRGRRRWDEPKKERTLFQFGDLLLSPSFFLFFFLRAFWHGLHPCVLALMACNVQGGGELVLLHTLSASPENTWQRASSKAAPAFLSQIPQAARAPPNHLLATPFFTVSTRLFTISKETDKIFTNLHTWMVKRERGGVEGRSIV